MVSYASTSTSRQLVLAPISMVPYATEINVEIGWEKAAFRARDYCWLEANGSSPDSPSR
jgi:hypothetical protein